MTHTHQPVAVIDIGSSAIRMAIAQPRADGSLQVIESLQQAVRLGKDTFTRGTISRETTEACVTALRSFRQVLREYGIADPRPVTAIATSAVREATNRDVFVDRLFIATGLDVQVADESRVNRLTFQSVAPLLQRHPELRNAKVLVVEVGGGTTEVLVVQAGQVLFSHTYRLGTLRIREILEQFHAPAARLRHLMEDYIRRGINFLLDDVRSFAPSFLLVLGGDARFAAGQLLPEWDKESAAALPLAGLERLVRDLARAPVDELVRQHHLPYADAETLYPALLTAQRMAQAFGFAHVMIAAATLRDGLLASLALQGSAAEAQAEQIIRAAMDLGFKYHFDRKTAEHGALLSRILFRALQAEHQLGAPYELLLQLAALLREAGRYVNDRSHHKHTLYLIQNSDLFGLTERQKQIVALVARYHRKAHPQPSHPEYMALERADRIVVSKLAAILRVADALESRRAQRLATVTVTVAEDRLILTAPDVSDISMEQIELQQKSRLFEQVYGKQVTLRLAQEKE